MDDFISFWFGINKIHPNIKITMNNTTPYQNLENSDNCECATQDSILFWDTSLRNEKGPIVSDLYKKPTDCNQYLLTNSTHPPDCITNIPFSLALRIKRVCMKTVDQETRFSELKQMLKERKYSDAMVDAAIWRAKLYQRKKPLIKWMIQTSPTRYLFFR